MASAEKTQLVIVQGPDPDVDDIQFVIDIEEWEVEDGDELLYTLIVVASSTYSDECQTDVRE